MSVVGHGRIGGTAVGLQDAPIGQCCRAGVSAYLRTVSDSILATILPGTGQQFFESRNGDDWGGLEDE